MRLSQELRERCSRVRLLVLDVDGVLTDGRLYYGDDGEGLKVFHVRDGLGLRLLREADVQTAVISARGSRALDARMRDLSITHVFTRRHDKQRAFEELLSSTGIPSEACAFVGDDVIDLPVLRRVGFSVAVADAHPLVRAEAHAVTTLGGGLGAVREVCDVILDCQGGLEASVQGFLGLAGTRVDADPGT